MNLRYGADIDTSFHSNAERFQRSRQRSTINVAQQRYTNSIFFHEGNSRKLVLYARILRVDIIKYSCAIARQKRECAMYRKKEHVCARAVHAPCTSPRKRIRTVCAMHHARAHIVLKHFSWNMCIGGRMIRAYMYTYKRPRGSGALQLLFTSAYNAISFYFASLPPLPLPSPLSSTCV